MKNTKATALRDALSSLKKKSMQSILITVGAVEPEEGPEHEADELKEKMPEAGGGVYTKKRGMGRMSDADAKSIARKLMG